MVILRRVSSTNFLHITNVENSIKTWQFLPNYISEYCVQLIFFKQCVLYINGLVQFLALPAAVDCRLFWHMSFVRSTELFILKLYLFLVLIKLSFPVLIICCIIIVLLLSSELHDLVKEIDDTWYKIPCILITMQSLWISDHDF